MSKTNDIFLPCFTIYLDRFRNDIDKNRLDEASQNGFILRGPLWVISNFNW
jgi:hypothetical protein